VKASVALVLMALPAMRAASTPKVTFYQNIAPIIYKNCSSCHRPGESGPFPLLSYDDVRKHAAQIADVTKRRYMPPWLPETGHGDFLEERRLSDAEIQAIQEWVTQGTPPGSASHPPQPPKFTSEWTLGTPDLVLHIPKPYQLAADGPEVFWNFVVPVPVARERWVKAMEVRPGDPRVFHHANVIIDRSQSARRLEPTPGLGFPGMDITFEETAFDPDSHFLSWKPGSPPVVEPDGMAWRADPGMDLVLNVHLRPSGKPETIDPVIGLYFTDKPQTRFAMLVQLQHDAAIDIPPGEKDFPVSDDFRAPLDLNVLAVYPHAHYLGKLMEGYATLPDGSKKWLIRIPQWDLNWQGVYRYKEPVFLPRGSIISMRYHYDNSTENVRNPSHPPKEVKGGNQATDEMSHFWLQVLPVGESDQRAVLQEAMARQRLQKDPTDFTANYNIGDMMLSRGDAEGSLPYFFAAWNAQPTNVVFATELGAALFSASKPAEARKQLLRALEIDPHYTDARFNLASVDASTGQWEAAAVEFKQVLSERPDDPKAVEHLSKVLIFWADALADAGNLEQAVPRYREALAYRPSDPALHTILGVGLLRLGQLKEAQSELEAAVRIDPNYQPAKQALAAIQGK
jgi:tetratricopeptide (TPR) repeat protein/mono/diheme cytochrome c family protein